VIGVLDQHNIVKKNPVLSVAMNELRKSLIELQVVISTSLQVCVLSSSNKLTG